MQNKRISLKRKKATRKAILLFLALVLFFIFLVWTSRNPKLLITDVSIEGNRAVAKNEIMNVVNTQLADNYFWFFPKRNIFLYPNTHIKSKILNIFKRVYFVDVQMDSLTSIKISIKERKPYALWCSMSVLDIQIENPKDCYFLDSKGFIFTKAPIFSGDVYFTVSGDLVQKDNADEDMNVGLLGNVFLGENRFAHLIKLRGLLEKEGIDTLRLKSIKDNNFEFYLIDGGKLIFNEKQDITKLLSNLISSIEVKINEKQQDGMNFDMVNLLNTIEYIDLRFGNKVLFKFVE